MLLSYILFFRVYIIYNFIGLKYEDVRGEIFGYLYCCISEFLLWDMLRVYGDWSGLIFMVSKVVFIIIIIERYYCRRILIFFFMKLKDINWNLVLFVWSLSLLIK